MRWFFVSWAVAAAAQDPAVPRAVVVESDGPSRDAIATVVRAAGFAVSPITFGDLCSTKILGSQQIDLLVLPDASALPIDSAPAIEAYLKGGGDILALNAPLWRTPLVRSGNDWIDRDSYRKAHAHEIMESVLITFSEPEDLEGWQRSTSNPAFTATHMLEPDPAAPFSSSPSKGGRGDVLHVAVDDIDSWDTFMSPQMDQPFPDGHTLTVFFAKGDANTPALSVEWTERDGSRWIGTVPLSTEWRVFVLQPSDFKFWESAESRRNTQFNPSEGNQIRIGLAFSHTPMRAGRHEYWLGPIGTAPRTGIAEPLLTRFTPPQLDTLCPDYKFFTCNDVTRLQRVDGVDAAMALPIGLLRSPHPRPGAGGFDKGRDWRFQPLLEATAEDLTWRGMPATLVVHAGGPYKGGVWASFGIEDAAWYQSPEALALIGSVARRMREGIFLIDGGANCYTYFPEQCVKLGLRGVNTARAPRDGLTGRITLTSARGELLREFRVSGELNPGYAPVFGSSAAPLRPEDAPAVVRAQIFRAGELIDAAEHEVHLWQPKAKPQYITIEDGEFVLDQGHLRAGLRTGQRWRAHGVNYMPSSGIGTEDWEYFEYWVGAKAYDPVIIQRDLEHIHAMGMNAVSIFIHHPSLESQNLLDLLRRLDVMGMKANLSLRPGTPLDFEWDKMRELLTYYRIAEHDCIFGLDLAWEPMFPDHEGRKRHDPAWRAWIVERYGSIESAEQDWQFQAPRSGHPERSEGSLITNPTDQMVTEDGEWRVMVAAYRRFLDTLLYEHYSRARRLVRSVDPHHLVSFRMTEAGDPTFRGTSVLPYDFPYLAAAVDILEPEAYGRIGDWEWIKPAIFEAAYGRWAAPHLPFMWAEAGVHVWDARAEGPLPERLEFQATYYANIYRMLIETGADGIFWWWYSGGYRTNERSDYGIINPDGTDRPVTKVIREHARKYLDGPTEPQPDTWITMDRDAHPAGVPGIYEHVKDEFWRLRDAGRTPGLKTDGAGTTSANCPLIAVGNVPCTGANPPKYLDAFFDRVIVRERAGKTPVGQWREVHEGETLLIPAGRDLMMRFEITNLGEATWLAPMSYSSPGEVFLAGENLSPRLRAPLQFDTPRFGSTTIYVEVFGPNIRPEGHHAEFFLEAQDRTAFGPRFTVTLAPALSLPAAADSNPFSQSYLRRRVPSSVYPSPIVQNLEIHSSNFWTFPAVSGALSPTRSRLNPCPRASLRAGRPPSSDGMPYAPEDGEVQRRRLRATGLSGLVRLEIDWHGAERSTSG